MPFSANVFRLLISCPGDIPPDDMKIVHQAINRWNGVYGHRFGASVLPISWGTHAAAEFGRAPQDAINDQLVDSCDICLALFANRLGTETANAESGTAEEIKRLHESGGYVGILRSRRLIDMSRIDYTQAQRLDEYLGGMRDKALILEYASDETLSQQVDLLLTTAVSRDQAKAEVRLTQEAGHSALVAEVWPRVESSERVDQDSKGRIRTRRNWYLVLSNTGNAPARDVQVSLTPSGGGQAWTVMADNSRGPTVEVQILAPQGDVRFAILSHMGIATDAMCTVSWTDDRGRQENSASLRLA